MDTATNIETIDTANEEIARLRQRLGKPKAAFEPNIARANALIAELEEQSPAEPKPKDEEKPAEPVKDKQKPGEAPTEQPVHEPEQKTGVARAIRANVKLQGSLAKGPRPTAQAPRPQVQEPTVPELKIGDKVLTGLSRTIAAVAINRKPNPVARKLYGWEKAAAANQALQKK